MSENSQDTDLNGAHIKRVAPAHSRNSNRGGQHRAIAHHRDVHDPHAPLHHP